VALHWEGMASWGGNKGYTVEKHKKGKLISEKTGQHTGTKPRGKEGEGDVKMRPEETLEGPRN